MDEQEIFRLLSQIDNTRAPVDDGDALAAALISEVDGDTSDPVLVEPWETDLVLDWSGLLTEGPAFMGLSPSAANLFGGPSKIVPRIFGAMANKGITPARLGVTGMGRILNYVETKNRAPMTLGGRATPAKMTVPIPARPSPNVRPRVQVVHNRPPPPPVIVARRRETTNRWLKKYGEEVVVQEGFYYGTSYAVLTGNTSPFLTFKKGSTIEFFTKFEGGTETILGTTTTLTRADTNLSKPGEDAYLKQTFLIEQVSLRFKSLWVKYDAATVDAAVGLSAEHKAALKGLMPVFDESGKAVPLTFFNDYSGRCDLLRALAAAASLNFEFRAMDAGVNSVQRTFLIDSLANLGITGLEEGFASRTSGGTTLPWLQDAYEWDLDKNNAGAAGFRSFITAERDAGFAYALGDPLLTGVGIPVLEVAVGLECKLKGTSYRPKSDVQRFLDSRGIY